MPVQPRSVVGIFCEDIRAEKSGAFTIIGVMPDHANIPQQPTEEVRGVIPKLCVYTRAQFDVSDTVNSITMAMQLPDGNEIEISALEPRIITRSFEAAKKRGNPLAIVTMRAEFLQFPVVALGKILVTVNVDDEKFVAAQLTLVHGEKPKASSPEDEQVTHVRRTVEIKPTSSSEPQQPS